MPTHVAGVEGKYKGKHGGLYAYVAYCSCGWEGPVRKLNEHPPRWRAHRAREAADQDAMAHLAHLKA